MTYRCRQTCRHDPSSQIIRPPLFVCYDTMSVVLDSGRQHLYQWEAPDGNQFLMDPLVSAPSQATPDAISHIIPIGLWIFCPWFRIDCSASQLHQDSPVTRLVPQSGGALGAEGYSGTGGFAGSMDGGRMGDTLYALGGHDPPASLRRRCMATCLHVRAAAVLMAAACGAKGCGEGPRATAERGSRGGVERRGSRGGVTGRAAGWEGRVLGQKQTRRQAARRGVVELPVPGCRVLLARTHTREARSMRPGEGRQYYKCDGCNGGNEGVRV